MATCYPRLVALAFAIGFVSQCAVAEPPVEFSAAERQKIAQLSPLPAPPADPTNAVADDPAAARLGQVLFFDRRLSSGGKVSCASCHNPGHGFADDRPFAEGLKEGKRRTPTLWNVAYNRWYFWDGRADTLWAQAIQPVASPDEHGFSRLELAHLVCGDPELKKSYAEIFGPAPDLSDTARFPRAGGPGRGVAAREAQAIWDAMQPVDRETINRVVSNIGKSVAAYERKLISRDSAFDRFAARLKGGGPAPESAPADFSPAAQRGLKLFIGKANCRLCHSGPNFSDGEFHNVRVPPLAGGAPHDPGRFDGCEKLKQDEFNAAGKYSADANGAAARKLAGMVVRPEMWGQFKTPTLRNVALHPPYMHQGQLVTLEDVVQHYSTLANALPADPHGGEQLLKRLELTPGESADLIAFLQSLTDEAVDPDLLKAPK